MQQHILAHDEAESLSDGFQCQQIVLLIGDCTPQFVTDLARLWAAVRLEIPLAVLGRNASQALGLKDAPRNDLSKLVALVDVGGIDTDVPEHKVAHVLAQYDGQRVRLRPHRASGIPHIDVATTLEFRHRMFGDLVEGLPIPEDTIDGYSYAPEHNAIIFGVNAVPPPQARITVEYRR